MDEVRTSTYRKNNTDYDFSFSGVGAYAPSQIFHDTAKTIRFVESKYDPDSYGIHIDITNESTGDVIFQTRSNPIDNEFAGQLINRKSGDITFKSISGTNVFEVFYAPTDDAIRNEGSGTIGFYGSANNANHSNPEQYAIKEFNINSTDYDQFTKIENTGTGKIFLQGAFGSIVGWGQMLLSNTGKGEFRIGEGGIGINGVNATFRQDNSEGNFLITANGIKENQLGITIENLKGTFSILGDSNGYAIQLLKHNLNSAATFENYGDMYFNTTSIGTLYTEGDPWWNGENWDGKKTLINHANATIHVEAGFLFDGKYDNPQNTGTPTPVDIVIARNNKTQLIQTNSYVDGGQKGSVTLKDFWARESQWEDGGSLVFTDVIEGSALAKSIRKQFESAFGTGTTLSFTATGSAGGSSDFTKAIVNTLVSEGKLMDGDVITSEALLLDKEGFKLASSGSTFDFNAIGFKGILGATDIKVADGKQLTLMGDQVSMVMAARATDEKPTNRITDSAMTLTNGHLNLGIESMSATGGVLSAIDVDRNSTVNVNNGVYVFESLTGKGQLNVAKKGQVYLSGTETSVNNSGIVTFEENVTLKDLGNSKAKINDPEYRNAGTTTFKDLTVEEGAELRNVKDGKVTATNLALHAGSELTNMGTLDVESLTGWGTIRNSGTINVKGELFVPGQSTQLLSGTVNAGELVIGEKPVEGASFFNRQANGTVMVQGKTFAEELTFNQGNVQVGQNAVLAHGMNEVAYKDFEKEHEALVKDKTVFVMDKTVTMGADDSIWVSTLMSDKNLALGDKSLVVMTGNDLKGHAMFEAKDGSTLTADIAEGAEFVFDGNMLGRHYIATGFDDASMDAFGSLTVKDLDDNTTMDVQTNNKGVFVVKGTDRISDIAPDVLFKGAFDYVLDAHQDTDSDNAMVAWISKLISAEEITNDSLTQATLTLAHAPALAGVQQQGLARTLAIADEVKDYHAKDGLLWASVLHGQSDVDGLDLGFGLEANYDVKTNGLVIGAELPLSQNFAVGTALSYQKSKVEDTGIQNEAETVAGSIYAKQSVGNFTFSESLTVSQGQHDAKGFASTDVDTQAFVIDLEGAYTHTFANGLAVQPYAGLRTSFLKVDDANIAMSGQDVVKHKGDTDTFVQMPVGIKVQKALETQNGWRVMGQAKMGAITTLGDTEAHSTVSAIGFAGNDAIQAQVLDRVTGDFGLNVMAATDNLQLGVGYNFQGSSSVKDHQVKANLRYVF